MKNMKLWSVILLVTVIICLLAPISEPLQAAASPVLVKSASAVVTSGVSASNSTVIYDSSAGLYKMWYVQTSSNDAARSYLYNLLNLDLGSTLAADLESGNFSTVSASSSDCTDIKAALNDLAGLSTSSITGYLNSMSTELKYATSPDGTTWTDQGAVTFPTAAWDEFISSPDVIKDGSTYKMWYSGYTINSTDLQSLFGALDAAGLSSANIKTLLGDIVSGNISQLRSDIVSLSLQTPVANVILDSLTLANDSAPAIGYATSADGITWAQDVSNPVMVTNTGAWDSLGVMTPSVIKNGSTYEMWYSGVDVSAGLLTGLTGATSISDIETALLSGVDVGIGYATSPNGETWTKAATPVLEKGSSTDWDSWGVFAPSVVMNSDGSYDMWYTGGKGSVATLFDYLHHSVTLNNLFLNGVNTAIGHATSTNGTTWIKDTASNPVLSKSSGGAWDNEGVAFPSVIANTSNIYLWYTGITANPTAALIGFFSGDILSSIVSTSGIGVKIGYASAAIPPVSTTTSVSPSVASGPVITSPGVVTVSLVVNSAGVFSQQVTDTSADGMTQLTINPGTVGLTANGTPLQQISITPVTSPPPPPVGADVIALPYEFGPSGATFNPPISMKFSYNPANIPSGVSETSLVVAYYSVSTGQWVTVPAVVDPVNHTITAQVSHFTVFSVMYIPPSITTPTTTPAPVLTGQVTTTPTSTPTTPVPVLTGQVTTTPTPTTTPSITSGTPAPTSTPTTTTTGLSSGWIIAIAVIGAVVIVIVVLAVIMGIRRKK